MSTLSLTILIHAVCALLALTTGCVIFFNPKRTALHKQLGYIYVLTLTLVDFTGLAMYAIKGSGLNAFHFLAVGNLIALYGSLIAITFKRPHRCWYRFHYYMISWSYVGLVTAALVEALVKSMQSPSVAIVVLLCLTAVVSGGIWIEFKTRHMGNVLPARLAATG